MIVSRSGFTGQGKYASRWLGDNQSTADQMGWSVTGVMMQNLLGTSLVGADICGFLGDTTPELCARWHTLGAFYPLSRNHNEYRAIDQQPWAWDDDPATKYYEEDVSYLDIMRDAIHLKYSLLAYFYTQITLVSTGEATGLFNPVFFEFPDSTAAYIDQRQNIMLGDALKLSINSHNLGQNETEFHFPAGIWCDIMHHD